MAATALYNTMDAVLHDIDDLKEWELMITWCSLPNSLENHIHGVAECSSTDREAQREFAKAAAEARAIVMSTLSPELLERVAARLNMNTATAENIVETARKTVLTDVDYQQTLFEFVNLDRLETNDMMYVTVGLKAIQCYHPDVYKTLCDQDTLDIGDIEYWLDFLAQTDDEFC
ncbi:hypothetical protein ACCO45_008102 [Purpureocillium lilacinum]|uniref:Uncharacterized protein n=1 Tax=Purpureocillium lilacinum TaxID=33203 RepID=A0ACC4DPQ2_PURLI